MIIFIDALSNTVHQCFQSCPSLDGLQSLERRGRGLQTQDLKLCPLLAQFVCKGREVYSIRMPEYMRLYLLITFKATDRMP